MKTLLLAIALLAPSVSPAQQVIVLGAGGISCGKWLATRDDPSVHYQYKQWVFGFVSGSNWYSGTQSLTIDGEAIVAFVDSYCAANPLHALPLAAAAAVQETGGPKAGHEWSR